MFIIFKGTEFRKIETMGPIKEEFLAVQFQI